MLLFVVSFIIIFGSLSFPVTAKRTVHDVEFGKEKASLGKWKRDSKNNEWKVVGIRGRVVTKRVAGLTNYISRREVRLTRVSGSVVRNLGRIGSGRIAGQSIRL